MKFLKITNYMYLENIKVHNYNIKIFFRFVLDPLEFALRTPNWQSFF